MARLVPLHGILTAISSPVLGQLLLEQPDRLHSNTSLLLTLTSHRTTLPLLRKLDTELLVVINLMLSLVTLPLSLVMVLPLSLVTVLLPRLVMALPLNLAMVLPLPLHLLQWVALLETPLPHP
jgi:hypothetical protein